MEREKSYTEEIILSIILLITTLYKKHKIDSIVIIIIAITILCTTRTGKLIFNLI